MNSIDNERIWQIAGWAFCGLITILLIIFVVLPMVTYNTADASGKCEIDLSSKGPGYFCDSENKIQSYEDIANKEAAEAEQTRRDALTPKQRCEEDHKSSNSGEDGDFIVLCDDAGEADYKSIDDLQEEYRDSQPTDESWDSTSETSASDDEDSTCSIKGNVSFNTGEKIYHVPGGSSYEATVINPSYGEKWFCTEQDAVNEGWRRAYN